MNQKLMTPLLVGIILVGCSAIISDGDKLFEDGKFKEAAEAYTAQIEQQGNDLNLIYNRGRAYEEAGDLELATKDFNYILEKEPTHLRASLSLAKLAYERKDYAKCLLMSQNAVEEHETSAQAHFLIGRAKHQLGYAQAALDAYNNAISLDKEMGEAYLYRGALKNSLKKKSACEDFKTAEILKADGAAEAVEKYCN